MKLLTFQHESIVEKLTSGIYKCEIVSKYKEATPRAYNIVTELLKEKISDNKEIVDLADFSKVQNIISPIFTWQQVFKDSLLTVDKATVERMLEMTRCLLDQYVLLELEVPEEFILSTSFYDFVDYRYFEEFEPTIGDQEFIKIENNITNLKEIYEIQSLIPFIKKDWVNKVYRVNQKIEGIMKRNIDTEIEEIELTI